MKQTQVMIVEDEELVGLDIKNNLTKYGYSVVGISSSGEDAIQSAMKNKPEIALMDIKLKGKMDGIETAKYLQKTLNIPTIYLTSFSDNITLTKALKANPYGYLLKPFIPMELHTTIQTALSRIEDEKNTRSENNFQKVKYISQNHFQCKEFGIQSKERNNYLEKMKVLLDNLCYIQNLEDNPMGVFPLLEFASILGYSENDIKRMGNLSIPILIHPDDYTKITDHFQKIISRKEEVFEIEFRLKDKSGIWKWFSNRCTFLEEAPGDLKTLNIIREITRIKNVEESFFIAQEKFNAISSNPYLGMVILDLNGKIIDVNPTLEQLMGYTKDEMCHMCHFNYMDIKGIDSISEQFQKMESNKIKFFQTEAIFYSKHKKEYSGHIVFSTTQNIDGIRQCVACSFLDISEAKPYQKYESDTQVIPKTD